MMPNERDLILKVHDGDPDNLHFIYLLYQHKHRVPMLRVLLSKGLTGRKLTEFIVTELGGEPLRWLGWVSTQIYTHQRVEKLQSGVNFS